MTAANTFELVRTIIVKHLDVSADIVEAETRLVDLGADSFDRIDVVMAIEEAFPQVGEISDKEIEFVETVADLVAMIERKAGPK
jgi:acyl carrier protein